MNKRFFILLLLFNYSVYSQFSAPNIIPSNGNGLNSIFSADFDGDGDLDIISTSDDLKLVWYENSDGNGTFINQHILVTNTGNSSLNDVYAADIDNDDKIDIIVAYSYSIVWYKNLDGLGNFNEGQVITYDDHITSVKVIDIDNDGYKDIVYSDTHSGSTIQWLKNIDGQGSFGSRQYIDGAGFHGPSNFSINDIDGDGDMDIVTSSYDYDFPYFAGNYVAWFQNIDGSGNFGPKQTILLSAGTPNDLLTLDIDNDGYLDIVVANFNEIYYLKNIDGLGNFSNKIILFSDLLTPMSITNFDYGNDEDQDLLVATYHGNKITLLINDGIANFNEEIIVSENVDGAISAFASNIDNDNFVDIISASHNDNVIAWYKNEISLSIEESDLFEFLIFPNPVVNALNIKSKSEITKIEIYNKIGQLINTTGNNIDISNLTQGLYFVKVEDVNGNFGMKKIVKK